MSHDPAAVVQSGLASYLADAIRNAPPMPATLRARLEDWFGQELGELRLGIAPGPSQIGARAFACRNTIIVEPDAFVPGTASGAALLIHETAHVIQQRGLPAVTGPMALCRDTALEREAERACVAPISGAALSRLRAAGTWLQCQANGTLNTHYLDGGTMNPPGGPITFAANNSMNEVHATRALAFARAKELLGLANSTARRTYHFWITGGGIQLGEGTDIAGNGNAPMVGAAAAQRTGRYYDFGLGKLIVEHPDDPNSWTSVGGGAQVQRGHFHCCQYEIGSGSAQSMYMLYDTHNGFARLAGEPAVYDWDRRFRFETANGGVTGHHVYYH